MKIIFSPEYSGTVYIKASDDSGVLMDTVVVNIIGLINMLELRMGLHYVDIPEHERVAHYYNAVCKYMTEHPGNVMEASFRTAGLSTAKAMLAWRDELRGAQWDFDGEDISERLAVLIGVEVEFMKMVKHDMASRLHIVTDQVLFQELDAKDMTIVMATEKSLLKPAVRCLIETLESRGATLELMPVAVNSDNNLAKVRQLITGKRKGRIVLDEKDESILVYKFADERAACEYFAYNDMEDVDVWVNAQNKQMDDWMVLMGKPRTGSVTPECAPRLTQLFVTGLGLFANPLNVNTLIEWLNMPMHPINAYFRAVLADTIIKEGGYRNEACREMIDRFVEGDFVYLTDEEKALPEEEQLKIRKKDRKKRSKMAGIFLPCVDNPECLRSEEVGVFVRELASWTRQCAHQKAKERGNEQWVGQLLAVASMCEAFGIMMNSVADEFIDYKTIDSWMSSIYQRNTYTHTVAEVGSRIVVDSPAKIAAVADKVVWIGVDGDASHAQECAFLYPTEKIKLKEQSYMHQWDENTANCYQEQMMLTPLRMTSGQLILVVRERIGGEPTLKHPLIVRLEQQIENFSAIVRYPKIDASKMHKANRIDNGNVDAEQKFDHADKIVWPDHLSPTAIGTLVEHPFDYLMEKLLGITSDEQAKMSDVKTIKGNVAHAVIEKLFAPRENQRCSMPDEIQERITLDFEEVYAQTIKGHGAILQLIENKLDEKLFHGQLRNCLDVLLEIIKENALKVTGCEHYVEANMGLPLPGASDADGCKQGRDLLGYIDMTLEDRHGCPVVFDFKWTLWGKGFQQKLQENRSVQLELYRMMLERETCKQVNRVAYFVMPEAHLYSKEHFVGKHCSQLEATNADCIVEQLKRSAAYRIKQLKSGIVETNGVYEELKYVKDAANKGLFPLKKNEKEGTKEANIFSQYGLFN